MIKVPVYLDYNATTPCDPRVVEALLPWFTEHFGNAASRTHAYGWQAEEAVSMAREQVASLVGAEPAEIVFTAGATEAVNLALKGAFEAYSKKGNHIITVATEHKAVVDTCKHLEARGARVTYLPVDSEGLMNVADLEAAICADTILLAVMYANNETGVIQPIADIGNIAKKHGLLFFSDATQAVGKIAVNVMSDKIDIMAFSAHKLYGPKGVGALYVRRKNPRVKLIAQIDGGGHEKGMRSGTLNVPGIVGFGEACKIAGQQMEEDGRRLSEFRNRLEAELNNVIVNGSTQHRLPQVSNVSFTAQLIGPLNKEIAVSSGSACTSALIEPSYVLKAMGVSDEQAYNSIRFSLGRFTTAEEIDFTIKRINEIQHDICKRQSEAAGIGIDAGAELN